MIRDGATLAALCPSKTSCPAASTVVYNVLDRLKAERMIAEPLEAARTAADDARTTSKTKALEEHQAKKIVICQHTEGARRFAGRRRCGLARRLNCVPQPPKERVRYLVGTVARNQESASGARAAQMAVGALARRTALKPAIPSSTN